MSIAFLGDPHFRFGFPTPYGMAGDYNKIMFNQINSLISILLDRNVRTLVFPGDVFDVRTPSKYSLVQINKHIEAFNLFKSAGITLYSISGNHDLATGSMDGYSDSIYKLFVDLGCIINIPYEGISVDNYKLFGVGFDPSLDSTKSRISRLNSTVNSSIHNILVMHEHCLPDGQSLPFDTPFINYSELATLASSFNTVFAGHLHKGFNTVNINNTHIVNPWSFSRLQRDYYNVSDAHKPTVVIFDGSTYTDVVVDHLPFNDLFLELRDSFLNSSQDTDFNNFFDKLERGASLDDSSLESSLGYSQLPHQVKILVDSFLETL